MSRTWKQVWTDSRGGITWYEGGLESPGHMRMTGGDATADGTSQLNRVSWKLLD